MVIVFERLREPAIASQLQDLLRTHFAIQGFLYFWQMELSCYYSGDNQFRGRGFCYKRMVLSSCCFYSRSQG